MKYIANPSFMKLGRENAHHGLTKIIFDRLKDGEAIEFEPPEWMIKRRLLKLVEPIENKTDELTPENDDTIAPVDEVDEKENGPTETEGK